jgi:hypothetical protein
LGGSRHPTPSWQVELPKLAHLRRRGLLGHEIPAGYWWYRPSRRQRQVAQDDPAFAVAPRPDQITVLIGRPGTRPPSAAAIYDRLAALPESVRERLLLVPYGSSATELDDVAERFSSDFRVTVERTAGMQVRRGDEDSCLAPDGTRALVQSVAYNGSGTPRITSWFSPIAGGLTKDDSTAPVGTRFTLDVRALRLVICVIAGHARKPGGVRPTGRSAPRPFFIEIGRHRRGGDARQSAG